MKSAETRERHRLSHRISVVVGQRQLIKFSVKLISEIREECITSDALYVAVAWGGAS